MTEYCEDTGAFNLSSGDYIGSGHLPFDDGTVATSTDNDKIEVKQSGIANNFDGSNTHKATLNDSNATPSWSHSFVNINRDYQMSMTYVTSTTPTGLLVTAQSDTQINLEWDEPASSNDIDYRIFRETPTSDGFIAITPDISGGTTTSFEDRNLIPDTLYSYKVSSKSDMPVWDASSDFALDADNAMPTGITFSDDIYYTVDDTDNRIYKYLDDGTVTSYVLDNTNNNPSGITVYDSKLWVTDNNPNTGSNKIFVYDLDGNPNTSLQRFNLDAGNQMPKGITAYDDKLWVVNDNNITLKVFVYNTDGTRDRDSDFDLETVNADPSGITHMEADLNEYLRQNYFLVLDNSDGMIYGYDADSGSYTDDINFEAAVTHDNLQGITMNGNNIYMVDIDTDSAITVAYNKNGLSAASSEESATTMALPLPPSALTSTTVSNSQIDLSWTASDSDLIVGHKIQRESPVANGFSDLIENTKTDVTTYQDDDSLAASTQYNYKVAALVSAGTVYDSDYGFMLASGNALGVGITYYDNKFWVLDRDAEKIFAYNTDGTPDNTFDIDLVDVNGDPVGMTTGITSLDDKLYVSTDSTAIYVFNPATSAYDSTFNLASISDSIQGITAYDGKLYVADTDYEESVYAYNPDGTRVEVDDFDLVLDNENPKGITVFGDKFWIVDRDGMKVFVYDADGEYAENRNFNLSSSQLDPKGITVFENVFYIVDGSMNQSFWL